MRPFRFSLMMICNALLVGAASAFDVPLYSAGASFAQSGYPAGKTIDGQVTPNNGWAVSPQTNASHRIWWETDGFLGGPSERYSFELSFRGTNAQTTYNIRQFTISYTTDANVSGSSTWVPFVPDIAETSNTALGVLQIDPGSGVVTLNGGGARSFEYVISAVAQTNAPVTGFSLQVFPVSNRVGTNSSGNFILTEFVAKITNAERIFVPEGVGSVDVSFDVTPASLAGTVLSPLYVASTADGADMEAPPALVVSAGRNHYSFPVKDDAVGESTEFLVAYTSFSRANYSPNHFYIVIVDDDPGAASFPNFVDAYGLQGDKALPESDPNDDGISNLEAYVHRLNPRGPFPGAWRERLPRFEQTTGRNVLPAISWDLPQPWPNDVRFRVGESEGLEEWTEIARRDGYGVGSLWGGSSGSGVGATGAGTRTVVVPGSVGVAARPRAFLRLELDYVPGGGGAN